MELARLQAALRSTGMDGWLFYDHHVRDPLAYRILGLAVPTLVSRRWWYFVPAAGEPQKLVHRIEAGRLDALPGVKTEYSTWQEMESALQTMLHDARIVAMQYSPRNAVMYVGLVDAGTVEMLREMGKTVVSSADLVSEFEAVLTPEQVESHGVAQRKIDAILEECWREMGRRVRATGTSEFEMMVWLQDALLSWGMLA